MGSIQVFPRRPAAAPRAGAWRAAPAAEATLRVREARLEDYGAVRTLLERAMPQFAPWSLRQYESRRLAFPEGQAVAESEGRVLGVSSALVIKWDRHGMEHTYDGITGEGSFTTHDPIGGTLYAADLAIDESADAFAAARALLQARRRLCRRRNLCRIIAPARLAACVEEGTENDPERYVRGVIWGDITDPWLRFQMSNGMHYCGVVRGFRPQDQEAGGHAALLAWLNPLHSPLGPPARIQPESRRKCA